LVIFSVMFGESQSAGSCEHPNPNECGGESQHTCFAMCRTKNTKGHCQAASRNKTG
jgi:hypothetical protein